MQYTMLRAIIQEVFTRAITYGVAVHNYVVSWTQRWPLAISRRQHPPQLMDRRHARSTMTFTSSWFYRVFSRFPFIWSTPNTERSSRGHRTPRTSSIKRFVCHRRALWMIWRKWCRTQIWRICGTISSCETRNCSTSKYSMKRMNFTKTQHSTHSCKWREFPHRNLENSKFIKIIFHLSLFLPLLSLWMQELNGDFAASWISWNDFRKLPQFRRENRFHENRTWKHKTAAADQRQSIE